MVRRGKIAGVISRTDAPEKVRGSLLRRMDEGRAGVVNLASEIKRVLPDNLMKLIMAIGRRSDEMGINSFLVGGFVRDILLGERNYDLDIVVEGDAIKFGGALAEDIGGSLVVYKKFGTAALVKKWPKWLGPSLHVDNKFKIDIASARKEMYKKPAALPDVEFSSLKEDLYRRDFTINAMAVGINRENFGSFIDFNGGIKDLNSRIIRVLHDGSFIDDPTRIFRAVRFEQRLGFKIEKHTEYLITHAIKKEMFHRTENQRIRDELILILNEDDALKAVFRMRELHELRFIHPALTLKRTIKNTFAELKKCVQWYIKADINKVRPDRWIMNFMIILENLGDKEVKDVIKKFVFTRAESLRLRSNMMYADKAVKRLSSAKKMTAVAVYKLLKPLPHEVTLCIMARASSSAARRRIKRFFTIHDNVSTCIKGDDIKKEGLAPGPRFKELLDEVLYRKIDGKLAAKRDEMRYLREIIKKKS